MYKNYRHGKRARGGIGNKIGLSQQKYNDYGDHYQSAKKNDAKALDKTARKSIFVIVVHVIHTLQYRRE